MMCTEESEERIENILGVGFKFDKTMRKKIMKTSSHTSSNLNHPSL